MISNNDDDDFDVLNMLSLLKNLFLNDDDLGLVVICKVANAMFSNEVQQICKMGSGSVYINIQKNTL